MGRGVWWAGIQAVTLVLGLLPACRTSPRYDSISPHGEKKKKKKTQTLQHPPPFANTDMFWEGATGRRQGLATPLVSCGRMAFRRTKHMLTTSPLPSLPKPVMFSTPGGSYVCFIREETGTKSFLCNTLLVAVAMFKLQKCRVEWGRRYHTGLPVLTPRFAEAPELPDVITFSTTY